jgi:hypothetical protein
VASLVLVGADCACACYCVGSVELIITGMIHPAVSGSGTNQKGARRIYRQLPYGVPYLWVTRMHPPSVPTTTLACGVRLLSSPRLSIVPET